MSLPVTFRRIHKWDVDFMGRPELLQIEIHVTKEVHPLSGMTLNLVEVDQVMNQVYQSLGPSPDGDFVQWALRCQDRLQTEVEERGAVLTRVQWTLLPDGPGFVWRHQNPEDLCRRASFRARITEGETLRTGHVQMLLHRNDFRRIQNDLPDLWETRVNDETEILSQLKSRFPEAFELSFHDLKTGESWRNER